MAWVFSVNTTPATGAETMYNLRAALVAAGWSCVSSGDGISAYSATDGTAITSAGTGANGMNNSNAWFRMRDPGGVREFLFQRGTTSLSWKSYYSALDKFTGGSPTFAVLPTSTDQQQIIGTGGAFNTAFFVTDATYRAHYGAQNSATNGVYPWYIVLTLNGTGATQKGSILMEAAATGSFPSADADPTIILVTTAASQITTGTLSSNTSSTIRGWYKMNLAGETFVLMTAFAYAPSAGAGWPGGTGTNPYDGDDNGIPMVYGRGSSLSTQVGHKLFGAFYLWKAVTSRAYPDTAGLSTANAHVYLDDIMVPWPTSTTPLT